jgi:hypothetical protein
LHKAVSESALARSGDEHAIAVLDAASSGDGKAFDALAALASANGSSAFVALDLAVVWGAGVEARCSSKASRTFSRSTRRTGRPRVSSRP